VFALGVLTAILAFYLPAQRSLTRVERERDQAQQRVDEVNDALDLEKERGDQRVAEVEAEVETLSAQVASLEEQIQGLQGDLSDSGLHVHILSALADVTGAQLALVQDDLEGANLALSNTPETLDALFDMVGADQQDTVSAMQQRLTLVQGGMEEDSATSLADLGILATNLLKLENTFFVEP
jgi:seryl-tRNA synthetase